jgi:cytochrome c
MSDIPKSAWIALLVLAVLCFLVPILSKAADNNGARAFSECAACHSTDGTNGVGPSLKGIVGRGSGSAPGFAYSNAMKHAQLQWSAAQLDKYIANPQAVVPGNTMPYTGMADAAQRTALITYLATLK